MVRPHKASLLHVSGTADSGDFGAEGFGNLDGECADPAGSAVDQDLLAGLDLAGIESLKCTDGCDGESCSGFEGDIRGLHHEVILPSEGVFSVTPIGGTEDFIAGLKAGDAGSDCLDPTGDVSAENGLFRPQPTCPKEADDDGSGYGSCIGFIDRRGDHFYQDMFFSENGPVDLFEL